MNFLAYIFKYKYIFIEKDPNLKSYTMSRLYLLAITKIAKIIDRRKLVILIL